MMSFDECGDDLFTYMSEISRLVLNALSADSLLKASKSTSPKSSSTGVVEGAANTSAFFSVSSGVVLARDNLKEDFCLGISKADVILNKVKRQITLISIN